MKYRIAAAILTIILIMGAGTAEQIIVAETMDEMLSRLDSFIVEEDEVYDYDEIRQTGEWWEKRVYDYDEIRQTGEWWEKRHKILELFLPHNQLSEISITYGELIGAVGAEDFDSAQALLTRIRMTCREFKNVYSVKIGNII